MTTALIQTELLSKNYQIGDWQVQALKQVTVQIQAGEFTAIIGPSGSGKTSLLNLIAGLDQPSSGKIWIQGQDIALFSGRQLANFRRDHLGFIFQAYNLIPVLTVRENIEYVMQLQGVAQAERNQRVANILESLELSGFEQRFPPQLSGGQQQRVAVARAMVSNPLLIFADEPTANLDSKNGTHLLDLMHTLNKKTGMTFVFSTHDAMIMERADRIITLRDGIVESDERKN